MATRCADVHSGFTGWLAVGPFFVYRPARSALPSMSIFSVVEFRDDELHDGGPLFNIIPSCWFTDERRAACFWPSGPNPEVTKAVQQQIKADPSWRAFSVRVVGHTDAYEDAQRMLARAEVISELQTENNAQRKRKRRPPQRAHLLSFGEEADSWEEDELPSLPYEFSSHSLAGYEPSFAPRMSGHSVAPRVRNSTHASHNLRNTCGSFGSSSHNDTDCHCVCKMLKKLVTMLEEVKDTQRVHSRMLDILLNQKVPMPVPVLERPEGAVFPLTTIQDVHDMDEKLCDVDFMAGVVAMVGEIGGNTLDDATRRMMAFLMSHELALQYNLFGRHGKNKFRELRLFDVVYGALKRNPVTHGITQKDAEKALSKWFTGARDRGGNRTARAQRELQKKMEGEVMPAEDEDFH